MLRWRAFFAALLAVGILWLPARPAGAQAGQTPQPKDQAVYVGSAACKDCHPKPYESYVKYSKKAHSSQSIKIMAKKLTPEELRGCFGCHTTGYGKPGGFKSFEETPELANAGCEVCHGPGSAHVDSGGDPAKIQAKMEMAGCEACHNAERVRAFNFKPMLFAGAH